ncbi:hypothetical protein GCM10025864_39550 [Luteimicrobium album]|uniref:Uncharacterized protein n=1 Tax=Luteimicrobium album TaxID=1054550 RepID=A0ABQ6I687_9MICO|nr:DUF6093 family protein [Luteimicrobium album]GMA26196.1 hypothetical protein GCM10025864_39550 [Luteimicrobium album]
MRAPSLTRHRANAEALMIDTCTVRRIVGSTEDPTTGAPVDTYEDVYQGKAKRQSEAQYEVTPDIGEAVFTVQRYLAHFPVGAFLPNVGDVIEWTACPEDPLRAGTKDRIVGRFNKSLATAMRVYVEQVVP